MSRLRYLPFIGGILDELHFQKHQRKMAKIRARDKTAPIFFEDEMLGTFTYTRSYTGGTFQVRRKWGEQTVRLEITVHGESPEPDMDMAAALITRARMFWEDQPGWESRMKECVFDEFYDHLDEDAQDHSKPCMTKREFLDSIRFDSISLSSTGKFEVWSPLAGLGDCAFVAVEGSLDDDGLRAEYYG